MTNSEASAFPVANTIANGERYQPLILGLTKREHFAGLCLQGILANRELQLSLYADCSTRYFIENGVTPFNALTFEAVRLADELLKQLSETK